MNNTIKVAAAMSVAGVLALAGCSSDSSGGGDTVNVVGYSVLQQANETGLGLWWFESGLERIQAGAN